MTPGSDRLGPGEVALELHGSDITRDAIETAGEHMIGLLEAVSEAMGAPGLRWTLGEPLFQCDGCGFTQPLDASRGGWVNAHGDDYCPSCLIGGAR